jgi:signal transduction histidine kinase
MGKQATAGSGLEFEIRITGRRISLPAETEDNLLRIAQEATNNAVKHAQAKHVWVHLNYRFLRLELSIADDGRGLQKNQAFIARASGGFGFTSMHERAVRMKGKIRVLSEPGKGTRVVVTIPHRRLF